MRQQVLVLCAVVAFSNVVVGADAILERWAASPHGFSVSGAGEAARWRVDRVSHDELIVSDSVSGLSVRRRYTWLAGVDAVAVDTTLVHRGAETVELGRVDVAVWPLGGTPDGDSLYRALTYRRDVWYDSTYWTGPNWTRVGKNWHHPGIHTPAVRCFTAPRAGRATITGNARKADTKCGDGVRLEVRHNLETVWTAEIDAADDKGVDVQLDLDLRAGDRVRFVVHKRGEIYCDTTYWDPVVTFADGESCRASEGFSTEKQGADNWSYVMDANELPGASPPSVHGFSRGLEPTESLLDGGRTIATTSRDALPLFVTGQPSDEGSAYLAIDPATEWAFRIDRGAWSGSDSPAETLIARLRVGAAGRPIALEPGAERSLPRVVVGTCGGSWLAGTIDLRRALDVELAAGRFATLRAQLETSARDVEDSPHSARTAFDLRAMVEADWRRQDRIAATVDSYRAASDRHLKRIRALLDDLRDEHGPAFLSAENGRLARWEDRARTATVDLPAARTLYRRIRWLGRRVALANPLMDFGALLFAKRVPTSYSHLVMQYYGWRARPGGGLFVLERPGYSLACRDILDGRLTRGSVLEPRLSYDGRRIVFSWVECASGGLAPGDVDNARGGRFYHLWEVNVDGTELRQITDGPFDDLMPTYLPDGGLAFCSTRRRGYSRCFGAQFSPRWDVYTLHRVERDGSDLRTLSFHDTNEWFPTVSENGLILYSRWDYIDRDAVTHQNLWAARPDGTNPIAVWGNATPSPHCTFQPQPIPGTGKVVFTASAHHSITAGSIVILDPSIAVDGHEAITRVTPEVPFPEAESRDIREYYSAPWPLSEKHFLVSYSPERLVWEPGANGPAALGLYLIDVFGTRELIYRDPTIGSTNPCPLRARPMPPAVASELPDVTAEDPEPTGEMLLVDVYDGLGDVPRGTIDALRIIQLFPKTTPLANRPAIGLAGEENARMILGTVPVEADGSARFLVPAHKPVLFQALDTDGLAYQTMRTLTYVQPGERVTCIGCHERPLTPPGNVGERVAFRRPPSRIDPGELGGVPFSYPRFVQPLLDEHCVRCHGGERTDGRVDLRGHPHRGFSRSYWALCGDRNFNGPGTNPRNAAEALVPRFGMRNRIERTPPGGLYGARGSRLIELLRTGHEGVQLSASELRRIAAWIDCNAVFYGSYGAEDQARELRGERPAVPTVE